jgi:hypothetical protein
MTDRIIIVFFFIKASPHSNYIINSGFLAIRQ